MNRTVTLPAASFPTHTPELLALFNDMNTTRVMLDRAMRSNPAALAFRLPEYKTSMTAYRAYWRAVDANKPHGPAY